MKGGESVVEDKKQNDEKVEVSENEDSKTPELTILKNRLVVEKI